MTDSWGSPLWLVSMLAEAFGAFDLDAAAEKWSALCPRFVTKRENVFKYAPPAKRVILNPPYSKGNLDRFVAFARRQVLLKNWGSVTLPVPHYTSEGWWQHVVRPEGRVLGAEWRFGELPAPLHNWTRLKSQHLITDIIQPAGRLEYRPPPTWRGEKESARFASVVVRFSSQSTRLDSRDS